MPITNGKYVNPGWKNGAAPALSAAELNAISDSIVSNATKITSLDSLIASLQSTISGKGQVALGSYVGTGTYGDDNPNSITFPFSVKVVWILGYLTNHSSYGDYFYQAFVNGNGLPACSVLLASELTTTFKQGFTLLDSTSQYNTWNGWAKKSADGKTVYWYIHAVKDVSTVQFNRSGTKYYYLGIG